MEERGNSELAQALNADQDRVTAFFTRSKQGLLPRCLQPWQSMMVEVSGVVQPCAYRGNYTNTQNAAPLGNLNETSLDEIWNGEKFQALRLAMARGDLESAGCTRCLALSQGQTLGLEYDVAAVAPEAPATPYRENLLLKMDEIGAGLAQLASKPTVLYYTPDHRCNLECVHCYQNVSRKDAIERREASQEVLALSPFLSDIIAGGGEPLILPLWRRFIADFDPALNPHLRFCTTTNATILRPDLLEGLKRFKRTALVISLDGARKATFEHIRVRSHFERFEENVRALRVLSSGAGQFFSFNISVMKSNILELPDLVRFCAGYEAPFNYQPVVAFPAAESLRCFNDPQAETRGWREALDEAALELDAVFLPRVRQAGKAGRAEWAETYSDVYHGHVAALRALVPWDILERPHHRVRIMLPRALAPFVVMVRHSGPSFRQKADKVLVLFMESSHGVLQEAFHYAVIENDLVLCLCLPDGDFRLSAISEDSALTPPAMAWETLKLTVQDGQARLQCNWLKLLWHMGCYHTLQFEYFVKRSIILSIRQSTIIWNDLSLFVRGGLRLFARKVLPKAIYRGLRAFVIGRSSRSIKQK